MPYELGLFIIILIVIIKLVLFFNKRSEDQRKDNRPIKSKPYNTYPKNTQSSQPTELKLTKTLKNDVDITSSQVTLLSHYSSYRDEFLGFVAVIDGHNITKKDIDDYRRSTNILKLWQFLGFGDLYDSGKRRSDFSNLAKKFTLETQTIISEFSEQGWDITLQPTDSSKEIYHLNR